MINNTVQPGVLFSPQSFGGSTGNNTSQTTPSMTSDQTTPAQYRGLPSVPTAPTVGLVSPSHPSVGTLPTSAPLSSHQVSTAPDGTTTSKVTYASPDQSVTSGGTSQTAQSTAPQTGNVNPGALTGVQYGSNSGGNPYTAPLAAISQAGSAPGQQYTAQTAQYGAGNIPIGQNAADIAANYGAQIANVGNKGAQFESGQLTTGTTPVAEGNAAITAQTTAAQQQALAQGESAALQGTGQQLTAQQQAEAAANAAAGQAYTGQGLVQGGLNQAASLAQPQLGSIGQVPYSPLNLSQGSPLGAPGGTAADAAKVAGQFQGAQAAAAAPGQAQASNIQTAGTTGTQIAASGLTDAVHDYQNLTQVNSAADANAANVQKILDATGLNSSNSNDYTKAINSLSGRLGNAQVTALNTAITELQNTYSQLLNSGGTTPTGSEAQALAVLNPASSAAQINAAITQLQTAATNKLTAASQKAQNYQASLGGTGSSAPSGGTVQTKVGAINTNW